MLKTQYYSIGDETIAISRYENSACPVRALVLHGAGQSDRTRVISLCENLLLHGIGSVSIDFSGHGESSANTPNSIQKRIDEANALLKMLNIEGPVSLFAFSMSGQVAISMAANSDNKVTDLVLLSPAVYCNEAITIPFGPVFSACIREEGSWKRSRAQELLSGFRGNLLVVTPEHDAVIPEGVSELILQAAPEGCRKKHMIVPDAPHTLGQWMCQNPGRSKELVDEMMVFLRNEPSILNY